MHYSPKLEWYFKNLLLDCCGLPGARTCFYNEYRLQDSSTRFPFWNDSLNACLPFWCDIEEKKIKFHDCLNMRIVCIYIYIYTSSQSFLMVRQLEPHVKQASLPSRGSYYRLGTNCRMLASRKTGWIDCSLLSWTIWQLRRKFERRIMDYKHCRQARTTAYSSSSVPTLEAHLPTSPWFGRWICYQMSDRRKADLRNKWTLQHASKPENMMKNLQCMTWVSILNAWYLFDIILLYLFCIYL